MNYYHKRSFSDKFWYDRDGRLVMWQRPNKLLIAWFLTFMISELFLHDTIRAIFGWIAYIAITIWAILEIFTGVNYFRRILGAAIFFLALLTRF